MILRVITKMETYATVDLDMDKLPAEYADILLNQPGAPVGDIEAWIWKQEEAGELEWTFDTDYDTSEIVTLDVID